MSDDLVADVYTDLQLNDSREVFVDGDGDLATTEGIENVTQSVAINVGDAIRDLIGQPTTAAEVGRVESLVEEAVRSDVQIDGVSRVEVVAINDTSVEIDIFSTMNNSFTIEVE